MVTRQRNNHVSLKNKAYKRDYFVVNSKVVTQIIGYSAGFNKDAKLVLKAFASIKINLNEINIFHTDRGNEFKNQLIDETLKTFNIRQSLSKKGCPYDNAVAEAT